MEQNKPRRTVLHNLVKKRLVSYSKASYLDWWYTFFICLYSKIHNYLKPLEIRFMCHESHCVHVTFLEQKINIFRIAHVQNEC